VLVLAWTAAPEHGVLALGADDLLPKSLAPQELVDRVVGLPSAAAEPRRRAV
jgi:DNA-binding response OmpR family regulator